MTKNRTRIWAVVIAAILCIVFASACAAEPPVQSEVLPPVSEPPKAEAPSPTETPPVPTSTPPQEETTEPTGNLAVWQADLTHDGMWETLTLTYEEELGLYTLTVANPEGDCLWEENAGIYHVDWNSLYLYERDGKQYLMRWNPYGNTGSVFYCYEVFSLTETGEQIILTGGQFMFDSNSVEALLSIDVERLRAFEGEVNALLEDTIILITTENGRPYYSTKDATLCKLWTAPVNAVLSWKQDAIYQHLMEFLTEEELKNAGMDLSSGSIFDMEQIDCDAGGTSRGLYLYRLHYVPSGEKKLEQVYYMVVDHIWKDPSVGQREQHTLLGILSEEDLQRFNKEEILKQYGHDLYRAAALETYQKYHGE